MATISATLVKDLREKTGVGMMECKKALEENNGDMEKAILWLRERGLSRAAKKADRVTAEGMVQVYVSPDQAAGVLVEVNCETDFVSKNNDFLKFADDVAQLALDKNTPSVEALMEQKMKSGETVQATLTNLISTIGENLNIRRVQVFKTSNGVVAGYSHMGGKIGTMVVLEGAKGSELVDLGKDIAMHIAAAAPRYMTSNDVDPAELEQERELARKKLIEQNKPENMIDKILQGNMQKFFKEVCLIEQPFVKDQTLSVGKLVEEKGKGAKIKTYARFQLGEGIEKKKANFAEEVAAQLR